MARGVTLYLHVHQPFRVRSYSVFDTAEQHDYFSESDWYSDRNNQRVFEKVADKSYRPMNHLLETLLTRHDDFKLSLSITGTFIEQAEHWAPDVLESFKRLVATGRVEILAETYYHSLAFFYSRAEFERQVELHQEKIESLFCVQPRVFRNTELAYNDSLAGWAEQRGYRGILAEGWDPVLDGRTPNAVYRPTGTQSIGLLLKNYRLSDDIAFRFSNKAWSEYPLSGQTFSNWVMDADDEHQTVNLFMDYETFGEHQWADTGIFSFFEAFIDDWSKRPDAVFHTVSSALEMAERPDELHVPHTTTWADSERDLSAWLGNSMQHEALRHLYALEEDVLRSGDEHLIHDWRLLQASDHVYYMSTKWHQDGTVHSYFSPYDSPYTAFLYYINVIRDMRWRVMQHRFQEKIYG